MLQIILFSAVASVALRQLPKDKFQPLFTLVGSLQAISMTVVSRAMRLTPYAVFGLLYKSVTLPTAYMMINKIISLASISVTSAPIE